MLWFACAFVVTLLILFTGYFTFRVYQDRHYSKYEKAGWMAVAFIYLAIVFYLGWTIPVPKPF